MKAVAVAMVGVLALGCEKTTEAGDAEQPRGGQTDTGASSDSGAPPAALTDCELLGLETVAFNPDGGSLPLRHYVAPDFTLPLMDGTDWTFSEHFSGCDSYMFLPHSLPVDEADNRSWWAEGMSGLLEKSPRNVHYFFVVRGNPADAEAMMTMMADDIGENLASLSDDDREWWTERLHVVSQPSNLVDGIISTGFSGNIGTYGLAIDRFQKFRSLGSFAAVDAYDAALDWPWERRIYEAGYQPQYYNYEFDRQVRLDAEDATVVEVLSGDVASQYADGTLRVPANLTDFDTLEIDVIMECPNTNAVEIGNCGAWDYLAHMWLQVEIPAEGTKSEDGEPDTPDDAAVDTGTDPAADTGSTAAADTGDAPDDGGDDGTGGGDGDDETEPVDPGPTIEYWEMARFITTYHRESRWVVDASHALAWLSAGEERTVRYKWAPPWNGQPTGVTTRFRFSNRGKADRASETVYLFRGGGFNTGYNTREPVEVAIPADVKRVELVAITTGHGMATDNCSEFCDHSHHFTINGTENVQNLDDPGLQSGCADKVSMGVVPNQAGTWWYGRAGWCPGQEVERYVVDVTDQLTIGDTATVTYEAKINGSAPFDDAGNIELNSWLVFHR
ncbi:MAG: peptide-N-glycosidase F-related protein [Myxococcota bacterium]|nr:peptide-N-glycosidase F-related protein [Myxococcota bacterium]